jgi:NAD(P)H dehydrogenase (quinone)
MNKSPIVVMGATGMFGGAVLDQLLEQGLKPRAITRSQSKGTSLADRGAIPVVADLAQPDSLGSALEGAEKAFLVSPMQPDLNVLEKNFIDHCKAAGVKHVVKLFGCVEHGNDPLVSLHLDAIAHLKKSGLGWTLVSPNTVMESNFFPHASTIKEESKLYTCAGDGRCGFVSVKDCADVAALVLTSDGHHGQDYQVTGPQALSFSEVADALSAVLGRKIEHVDIPDETMLEILCSTGLTPEQAEMQVLCHFRLFKEGKASLVTDTVERLLGRPAISVEVFLRENVDKFKS